MTDYETQALVIAKATASYYWWADVIAACALGAAVIAGLFAFYNLRTIIGQLNVMRWNSLLSFEQDMAHRRAKFTEIGHQMEAGTPPTLLRVMFEEAKESYFNSLDRLASSILRGHFPDTEMKQDYRDVITGVVREFETDFGTGTRYRKIVELYNRWQD